MAENKDKVFSNMVINWLSCIYGDFHLNPYKIRAFKS